MKEKLILLFIVITFVILITSVSAQVKYVSGITCQPNTLRCEENNLYRCNSEGNDINLVKECEQGCEYVVGNPLAKCKEDPLQKDPISFPEKEFKYTPQIVTGVIIGIAVIVGFIILAVVLKKVFKK